jgi:uncharacterized membrane protein
MDMKLSKTQKLTYSAMIMAIYITIMYFTQSFAFGQYQIRIATAMYGLAYLFPFLVIPMGLSNFIANFLFGGLGVLDMVGGMIVGIVTTSLIVLIRKQGWNMKWMALPIVLVPGLGVSTYLSYLLHVPYSALAVSLCIGQLIPSVCGVLLVQVLKKTWKAGATV